MAYNWFGNTALVTLISKIKTLADTKVDKEAGKGLSTNDFTTAEKTKLEELENYTLPTASSSTLGGIKVGTGLSIDENGILKTTEVGGVASVNGQVGEVVLTAGDVGAYTKAEVDAKVTSVYRYKGSVATKSALPTEGLTVGDVYDVEDTGMNYSWTGTKWDALGNFFDPSGLVKSSEMVEMTATDVDNAWKSAFNS